MKCVSFSFEKGRISLRSIPLTKEKLAAEFEKEDALHVLLEVRNSCHVRFETLSEMSATFADTRHSDFPTTTGWTRKKLFAFTLH